MSNVINYYKTGTYGGTREVFTPYARNREFLVENGAKLASAQAPAVGESIYAGDFGYLNESTGTVTLLKTFKLHTALTTNSTEVIFIQDEFSHVLHEGDIVMVGGATGTTTGAGRTVGTITKAVIAGVPVAKFAITANDFGAVAANTIFVIADAAHASTAKPVVSTINTVFIETVKIKTPINTNSTLTDGYGDYTVALAYHATMLKESIYIPTYVEALNKISNSTRYFEL